jgi:hypothetical protein
MLALTGHYLGANHVNNMAGAEAEQARLNQAKSLWLVSCLSPQDKVGGTRGSIDLVRTRWPVQRHGDGRRQGTDTKRVPTKMSRSKLPRQADGASLAVDERG